MNILFFGSTNYSVIVADILHTRFGLTAVVTLNDRPDKRKKAPVPNPVKAFGIQHTIPVITADTLDEETMKRIGEFQPDFFVVLDYGLIIPDALLKLPTHAALNIHPSLLPKYRGPSPVPSTILAGDTISGVTIIEMTSEVDAGAILAQKEYVLKPDETTDSLLTTLDMLGGEIILSVINQYVNGTITKTKQDDTKATFTQKYQKADGYIDVDNPPNKEKLDRMIRAFHPWLGVWTIMSTNERDTRIKLLPQKKLQVEGKKPMSLKDFFNGYPEMREKIEKLFDN